MLSLPGLIDPHVHLRTPGQSQKEDFKTGTIAALAGGYTTVIDMPNNATPITTFEKLKKKQEIAKKQIVSDIGFYFGSLGDNFDEFSKVQKSVIGMKIYLNQTTGGFIVDNNIFAKICENWPINLPILLHAEADVIEQIIEIGHKSKQRIHICHVSSEKELRIIINAKQKGYRVTCGITPHHLFLNSNEGKKLGPFAMMKPSLKPQTDVDFLWNHLRDIDMIESDHAPHTLGEKKSKNPPFGVPGLETTLGLLLSAATKNKLTIEEITRLCHDGPAKLLNVSSDPKTTITIDENEQWTVKNENLFTKCGWSPWNGRKFIGKVKKVKIRGTKVFEDDKILVKPGFGKILNSVI